MKVKSRLLRKVEGKGKERGKGRYKRVIERVNVIKVHMHLYGNVVMKPLTIYIIYHMPFKNT
jgi:hypothetical protein